jgi:uncharacterized membrane protein YdjX (TVP38/TMEM64 family)
MSKNNYQTAVKIVPAIGLGICISLFVVGLKTGIFTSVDTLQSFIGRFGLAGPVVFILFQAVQVVIPILPGGLGCLGGVVLFGVWKGFWYNYIGICLGSNLAFLIAKYYGKPILFHMFNEKMIAKYEKWTSSESHFAKWFAVAIFFPIAPDDFLCYLAGTTEMSMKRFNTIILLGKPFAISLYSLGLMTVFSHITTYLGFGG